MWAEFTEWLEADDGHRLAFDRIESLYADLDVVADELAPFLDAPRPAILSRPRTAAARTRRRAWSAAAGAALLAASVILAVRHFRSPMAPTATEYATGVGETRALSLPDGSTVVLNTRTAIVVAFTPHDRRVRLEHGEALFRVARDAARPFAVRVGDWNVRDIGTVFDIVRDAGRSTVTVTEGRVAVSTVEDDGRPGQPPSVQLSPGDSLSRTDGLAATVRHVDPGTAASWVNGYLVYENAPLSRVVSDLNRYFPRRILLKDADAGRLQFSGILRIDSEDAVLERLGQLLPVAVERTENGPVTLRLAPRRN